PVGENQPMSKPKPILNARSLDCLRDAVGGKVPERLLLTTVGVAVRLARSKAISAEVLPERILELVRQTLKALPRQPGKPDTALWLHRRLEEGGHGLSQ